MAVAAKTALNLAGNDQTVVYSIDGSPDIKKELKRQIVRLQEPLHSRRSTSERKRLILHWIFWRKDFEKETSVDVFMINKENVEMYGADGWQ